MDPPLLRDHLASERTLLAWIRTNLALSAFGFVVARLGVSVGTAPTTPAGIGLSELAGLGFVAVGLVSQLIATQRYLATRRALADGTPAKPGSVAPVVIGLCGVILAAAAVTYVVASAVGR